ncbi:hypothetical protein Kuja_1580 [Vibrio phage vB_VchM_Kuja]|uniref:DUF7424 domain-containing protein n=1 Tax=Vibrio phage vB_VchM_Kuja TaxID=2686437 RepID=A0A6B9J9K0_9CAUD|nr:hypothetical protein HWC83_gp078 [Vibrio phage vB_VchM_Kuja]QGZ16149.1 hypothetical protein Kuja_1580 [Vibrio phage vB_VchM_Kuja]
MKKRKLGSLLASVLVVSCKTQVNIDYDINELKKYRVPVSVVYKLGDECKPISIEGLDTICEVGKISGILDVETYEKVEDLNIINPIHLFLSNEGTLIVYMSKELRDEIILKYGNTKQISENIIVTIRITNKTDSIKTLTIQGSWVNGSPTDRLSGSLFYLKGGDFLDLVVADVAVGNLLQGGLEVIASIK